MLKMKSTKISTLLVAAGLMILPVFMAACETDSNSAETPFGLRTESTDTHVESETGDVSQTAGTTSSDVVDPPVVEVVEETLSDVVTAGVNGNNNQSRNAGRNTVSSAARIADRSEHIFDPETAAELSSAEIEGLTYMREEEKLARDVYLALYDTWGAPIFQNIAGSEQAHMDSVLMLLDQYGLMDPAAGKESGEFTDHLFQSLYEQLVVQGSLSQADALTVGATIEELDIVDLEERLAQTDNEYIIQVYSNLLAGSDNHLRAFVSNLERQTGELYQPIYLTQDAYQAIMNGAAERGAGNGEYGGGSDSGGNRGNRGSGGNGSGRRNGQGQGSNA
jgi:hypothetical protein